MPEPNLPNDGTRKRLPHEIPELPSPPTGSWNPESADPSDPSGVQLAVPSRIGQYEVKAVLGVGTYGRVFLAFDPMVQRQVAIKQPFGEGLKLEYREDFLKDARAAAAIDHHANICQVYHVGEEGGLPYIVMRFIPGGTLKNMLDRRAELLPTRSALVIARKIALGLAAAHAKGIIHRDLKPANVLYDDANNEVLITDFGLARVASRAQAAASLNRGAHGTPLYMPPEQWGSQAFGPITPVADLYSLGVILFEMLTGETPFSGSQFELMTRHCTEPPPRPSSLRFGLDTRLDALCLKAIEKQPGNRYRSAREFADAIGDYLRGGGANAELIEAIPVGEEFDEPVPRTEKPAPPPLPWAEPLPEPAPRPRRRDEAPPSDSTASLREATTIEEKEIVRCPKCNARLEIGQKRTKPIDCPMCNLKFAVDAGRQAAARGSRTGEREKLPDSQSRSRRGERDDRRDDRREARRDEGRPRRVEREERAERREDRHEDGGIPQWHWKPAARGLRVAWFGMVFSLVCAFLLIITAIAGAANDEPSSRSGDAPGSYTKKKDEGEWKSTRRSSDGLFHAAYTMLGIGVSLGIVAMSVGRLLAGRLPAGVRGGTAATLSAVSGWAAAGCAAIPFLLIHWLVEEDREGRGPGHTTLTAVATIASCAAMLLLLVSEFAFNSYLSAIGRRVRDFPRALVTIAKVFVWILLVCVVFGAISGGIASAMSGPREPPALLLVIVGGAMCLGMAMAPVWGVVTLWLNVHAAVAVGRYAHARG